MADVMDSITYAELCQHIPNQKRGRGRRGRHAEASHRAALDSNDIVFKFLLFL